MIVERLESPFWSWFLTRDGWRTFRGVRSVFLPWAIFMHKNAASRLSERLKRSGKSVPAETMASREALVQGKDVRFVVAGHTHEPQVALVGDVLDQYYVNTGTFRHRVLSLNQVGFVRLKALAYVAFYASSEDRGHPPVNKTDSFNYWSGFTQRWRV